MKITAKLGKIKGNEKFSVVIPTWNNLDYLKLCVESIEKNSRYEHQIIVHVNEGRDGTLDWLEEKKISYTFSPENVGICFGLNAARRLLRTDYFVYLNDDMYVCKDWDKYLLEEIEALDSEYFFLSATMIEPSTNNPAAIEFDCGRDIQSFDEEKLNANCPKLKKEDWSGATWPPNVVHKNLWDLAGGYSVEFSPGMYSDPDFSMKLWRAGVRIFKGVGKSRVYHFSSKTTKRIKKNDGYYKFIDKWGITARTFAEKYLKRGKPFEGELAEPELFLRDKFNAKVKKILNGIVK